MRRRSALRTGRTVSHDSRCGGRPNSLRARAVTVTDVRGAVSGRVA
ncbi:hypothetical protein SGM_5144 [Streptomyces griseoaurantiacus M045]|uniref:Uncharacterized protein n=1 Tax=Streptomyces griseoaurantiacus M045 TaxID=996637 RepID=F3NQ69_9ACTN|nr:hypothetical protein SGM_5144 [Streptomyces griseoaurantiacus M045]